MTMMVNSHRFGVGAGGISFVGSMTFNAPGATGTFSLALSNLLDAGGGTPSVAANDFILINYGTGHSADLAYTPPTGYTELYEQAATGTFTFANQAVWHKFVDPTPETQILAVPHSGSNAAALAMTVHVFRGVDLVTPFDVAFNAGSHAAVGTATGRPNPSAITPATAGAWIVAMGVGATDGTAVLLTNPGDLSATTNHFRADLAQDTRGAQVATGIKTDWVSGAFDPSQFTGGTTAADDSWAAVTVALKPA